MKVFLYILAAVALLVSVTDASPAYIGMKRMTNADRLKRGLGPAPPVLRRVIPGRSLTPTRLFAASKRGSPSPSISPVPHAVPTPHVGRIEVRNTTGFSFGYVENTVSGVSGVTVNSSIEPLAVTFSTTSGSSGPFDITATNATFTGPLTLGGVGSTILAADSASAVVFNATNSTAGEVKIWTLDGRTAQISAHWTNTDNSTPTTFIGLDVTNNHLLLTGNISLYNQAVTSATLTEVQFFLASPPFL
ncbi:hypothetical protein EUX98_g1720 [Antrodiella citrinella]|uniref:Uncharacterized protein n=1 Tax=Antrodiella citrinella TaxID=2447956 RepID=A0A4S4N948_9APHY|nr:hypothetical protein EUX98_g1720 [Antrodiella citrinella]